MRGGEEIQGRDGHGGKLGGVPAGPGNGILSHPFSDRKEKEERVIRLQPFI